MYPFDCREATAVPRGTAFLTARNGLTEAGGLNATLMGHKLGLCLWKSSISPNSRPLRKTSFSQKPYSQRCRLITEPRPDLESPGTYLRDVHRRDGPAVNAVTRRPVRDQKAVARLRGKRLQTEILGTVSFITSGSWEVQCRHNPGPV